MMSAVDPTIMHREIITAPNDTNTHTIIREREIETDKKNYEEDCHIQNIFIKIRDVCEVCKLTHARDVSI